MHTCFYIFSWYASPSHVVGMLDICAMHVLCRLGYMFWSDVNHNVIVRAQLNGTEVKILVNSSINVSGNVWTFAP